MNKDTGKGAMMRRGATVAHNNLASSGLLGKVTGKQDDVNKIISDAIGLKLGLR